MVAEEVASGIDVSPSNFSATSPRTRSPSINEVAEDLSDIMIRAQNSASTSKRAPSESSTSSKSKTKSNSTSASSSASPFSWSSYLKPCDLDILETSPGATTTRRKSAGSSSETSTPTRPSSATNSSQSNSNKNIKAASKSESPSSALHRRLGREEMKIFGLIPLEDKQRLLQCPTCQRILMDHAYTSHTSKCRYIAPVKPEPVKFESLAKQSSTPPPNSDTAKKTPSTINLVPTTSYSPMPTTAATPPPALAKASNGRPTIKQSASASRQASSPHITVDTSSKQTQATQPIVRASSTGSATSLASKATSRESYPPQSVTTIYAPPSYAQASTAAPNNMVTPVRSATNSLTHSLPQSPPARASPASPPYHSPPGTVVMVTSPRSGLKASIGPAQNTPTYRRSADTYTMYSTPPNQPLAGTTVNQSINASRTLTSSQVTPPSTSINGSVASSRASAKRTREDPHTISPTNAIQQRSNEDLYSPGFTPQKRVSYGVPPLGPSPSRSINSSRNSAPSPSASPAAHGNRVSFTTTPTKSVMVTSPGPSKRPPLASPTPVHAQHLPSNSQPMNWVRTASMAPLPAASHGPSYAPTFSTLPSSNSYQMATTTESNENFISPSALQGNSNGMDPDYAMFAEVESNSYFPPAAADDIFR